MKMGDTASVLATLPSGLSALVSVSDAARPAGLDDRFPSALGRLYRRNDALRIGQRAHVPAHRNGMRR